MNNPCDYWEKRSSQLNDLLDTPDDPLEIPFIKKINQIVAWQDNNTFENSVGELHNLREKLPEFFELFDYDWVVEKHNYDFPQEALYQLFVLDAAMGFWFNLPSDKKRAVEFGGLCPRYRIKWDMQGGSPRCVPFSESDKGFRFVSVPFAWFDMVGLAIDALLGEQAESFSIDTFSPNLQQAVENESTPYWDALIIRAIAGLLNCPQNLMPELFDLASSHFGAQFDLDGYKSMSSSLQLNALCQRFTMAHEVGHHLESAFDRDERIDNEELMADLIALYALNSKDWVQNENDFAPLIENAAFVPYVSGISFYYSLSMTAHTMSAISFTQAKDVARAQHLSRMNLLESRIGQWFGATSTLNQEIVESRREVDQIAFSQIKKFSRYSMEHSERYAEYAVGRARDIFPVVKEMVADLEKNNPLARDPIAINSELDRVLGNDPAKAVKTLLNKNMPKD